MSSPVVRQSGGPVPIVRQSGGPMRVDLNADLGEGSGFDDELLQLVTSANIATGFHVGDADSMRKAVATAKVNHAAIGAHPSLLDRENFGRKEREASPEEVHEAVTYQIGVLQAIAEHAGARVKHVKPHGALYNMASRRADLAEAVARAVAGIDPHLLLFALPGSELERAGQSAGLRVIPEFFADRNYMPDGSLVSRRRPDALLDDPDKVSARVVAMLSEGRISAVDGSEISVRGETVCVHGDTPDAVAFVRALRARLEAAQVRIAAPTAHS